MKRIISILLLSLTVTAATAQENVTIKGNVTGDTKGYNKIYFYGKNIPKDSVVLKNGTFSFSVPYTKDFFLALYSEYETKLIGLGLPFRAMVDGPCNLVLKDADITKGLKSGTWSGNTSAEDYQAFERMVAPLPDEVKKTLSTKYPGRTLRDLSYGKAYDSLMQVSTGAQLKTFVKDHPDSYAATELLRSKRNQVPNEDIKAAYALLSDRQKATETGKDLGIYLIGLENSAIGNMVTDFTLLTPAEKALTFSSLKGKYVLLDFWASWCGPCKASFPHIKKLYAKYKGNKFEIYSISVDKDKAAWLKELKQQALPWLQAQDTKDIAKTNFAVSGIPTTYLINPEGKIIMKEIGFNAETLDKKLSELFSKN